MSVRVHILQNRAHSSVLERQLDDVVAVELVDFLELILGQGVRRVDRHRLPYLRGGLRLARAGTREVMLTDTVKFARAAGIAESVILRRHVLRLISIPLVTVFGLEFASTLAFAVVTETIFSWPGIGKLIIDSIQSLDRPVMVAYLMLVAFVFIMINFLVDLTYFALDPRLRKGRA